MTSNPLIPTADFIESYAVPVARSLTIAAPGPLCAVVIRSQARVPTIRVAPARFRIRGQGHTTAQKSSNAAIQGLPTIGMPFGMIYHLTAGPGRPVLLFHRGCRPNSRQSRIHGSRVVPPQANSRREACVRSWAVAGMDDFARRIGPHSGGRAVTSPILVVPDRFQTV